MNELPVLELKCEACEGKGGHFDSEGWNYCPHCAGAGNIPTEAGEKIIKLILGNFALLEQMSHDMQRLRNGG